MSYKLHGTFLKIYFNIFYENDKGKGDFYIYNSIKLCWNRKKMQISTI